MAKFTFDTHIISLHVIYLRRLKHEQNRTGRAAYQLYGALCCHIGKKLPDDIIVKLDELAEKEDSPLSKVIYQTMKRNQDLAVKLNRPSCQDTGVLQFWVKCGTKFPLIDDLEVLLKEAVVRATVDAPLRHNSVETFDEYNTGKNVGKGLLLYSGISFQTVINVRFTHIWQVVAVHFLEKQWY